MSPVTWNQILAELKETEASADEFLTDLHKLIKLEGKEVGEIHSLSERVHILQGAMTNLVFAEGVFDAEEVMDWTVEMLDILDEEEDKAIHFVLELEAAEKVGNKWVAKHHNKIISEIELEKLKEEHFILKVKEKLGELKTTYERIKEDLEDGDKNRVGQLILALIHGLEHLTS